MSEQSGPAPTGTWTPRSTEATKLILLRHGVTTSTLALRYAGSSDLPLVEQGLAQAAGAAARLGKEGIDAIISSPLTRTRQTAQATADVLGLPVTVHDGFAETDFGAWEGLSFSEVRDGWPTEMAEWMADASVAPPGGGESFETVSVRVESALRDVLAEHAGKTVLVVSHVTPIKSLVRLALGAPIEALHRMHLSPASISIINYYADGNVSLALFNDTSHL